MTKGGKLPQVVHIHIPRTGGTALKAHLKEHIHRYVSAHSWWETPVPAGPLCFIVLREPTERVSSLYNFIRVPQVAHKHSEWLGRVTLAELMRDPAARTIQFANGQVRQICGSTAASQEITAAHLEQAWTNLNAPKVIAVPLDYVDEGLEVLGRRLGQTIPPLTRIENAVSHQLLDPVTASAIRRLNTWDMLLYARLLAHWQQANLAGR